jgi:hypothetical protein
MFSVMGDLPTIITMGERFGCKPMEVRKWRAEDVYSILYFDYERSEYQSRVDKLRKVFNAPDPE